MGLTTLKKLPKNLIAAKRNARLPYWLLGANRVSHPWSTWGAMEMLEISVSLFRREFLCFSQLQIFSIGAVVTFFP